LNELKFQILGSVGAHRGEEAVELGPPKQRAFLALLLVHPGRDVSRERLVDELWPEDPPPTAVKALQVFASRLRKALGTESSLLVTRGKGYALQIDPEIVDAARFERLVSEGQAALDAGRARQAQGDPAGSARALARRSAR
jgi:DNA-binding SARP family transcriptional activator